MTYDAVVFDNDGVLVGPTDFEVLQGAAWDAFEEAGVDDPHPDHVEAMAGGVVPGDIDAISDLYGLDPAEFWRVRDRAASLAQQREMREGRKTLYDDVDTVRDLGVPLGIVSSNQQQTLDFQLDYFGVSGLFETVYGRQPTIESLHRKKPEPHYIERALDDIADGNGVGDRNWGGASDRDDGAASALFVGDNESDITAAVNAGVDSAFIRRPHREYHDLSVSPTHEIDDLHDLHGLVRG